MTTNTNIKYAPYKDEKYKIELAAERISALLKALDIADGAEELTDKTLEDLNAIIQTIIEWDTSDDSLGVKEQLLNIYNSMLSIEAFEEYKTEIESAIPYFPATLRHAESDGEHCFNFYSVTVPQYEGKAIPFGFTMAIVPDKNSLYDEGQNNIVNIDINNYETVDLLGYGLNRFYSCSPIVITQCATDADREMFGLPFFHHWSIDRALTEALAAHKRIDELETQVGDISSVLASIQTGLDETLELQNSYIGGTSNETV